MANPLSLLKQSQSLIPPETVKSALSSTPGYKVNRERAAAVFRQGLAAYETYAKIQPVAFYGSLAGAAACGWALWKRKGGEARTLYGTGLAVCLAVAWFTRPMPQPAAPKGATPEEKAGLGLVAYLDRKRAEYAAKDPAWADQTMGKVAGIPGIREQVEAAPILRAVLG